MTRVGVVGHVEWVRFAIVERVPRAGEIVHARETFSEPAGGGAVAAVQLRKLAGSAIFLTALGDDAIAQRAASELGGRPRDRAARGRARAAAAPDVHVRRRRRRADDHRARRAHRALVGGPAAVGQARGARRGLLHGRRRRRGARRPRRARARRHGPRARRARRRARTGSTCSCAASTIPARPTSRACSTRRRASCSARAALTAARGRARRRARGARRRRPVRPSTPTAAATRSPPASPTGSAPAWSCRTRSSSARAAARPACRGRGPYGAQLERRQPARGNANSITERSVAVRAAGRARRAPCQLLGDIRPLSDNPRGQARLRTVPLIDAVRAAPRARRLTRRRTAAPETASHRPSAQTSIRPRGSRGRRRARG